MLSNSQVVIELLDSIKGIPIQSWRFGDDVEAIRIGRAEESDVTLESQQVSRLHVMLDRVEPRRWQLISVGRNGTIVKGKVVTEYLVQSDAVIQLGASGPQLQIRFSQGEASPHRHATLEMQVADFKDLFVDADSAAAQADQLAQQLDLNRWRPPKSGTPDKPDEDSNRQADP